MSILKQFNYAFVVDGTIIDIESPYHGLSYFHLEKDGQIIELDYPTTLDDALRLAIEYVEKREGILTTGG